MCEGCVDTVVDRTLAFQHSTAGLQVFFFPWNFFCHNCRSTLFGVRKLSLILFKCLLQSAAGSRGNLFYFFERGVDRA